MPQKLSAGEIVKKAFERSSAHESLIEKLGVDVILVILEHADFSSPVNLALTGPVLYTLVLKNEARIAKIAVGTLANTIGDRLMPFAIALHELRALGEQSPRSYREDYYKPSDPEAVQPVVQILDRHIGPGKRANGRLYQGIDTFGVVAEYRRFDNIVKKWTNLLAPKILENIMERCPRRPEGDAQLTNTETLRIHKALYIYELARTAFPWMTPERGGHGEAWGRLCARVSPWEMEQTRNLQPLLLGQLTPAIKKQLRIAAYQNHVENKVSYFYSFLLARDLETLLSMHSQSKSGEVEAQVWKHRLRMPALMRVMNPRIFPFTAVDEADTFFEDNEQDCTNLDATNIFLRYPEEDIGPKAWWYYQFLSVHLNLGEGRWQREVFYRCRVCMPFVGYAFCDYATLCEAMYPAPSLQQPDSLVAQIRGTSRSRTEVQEKARGWAGDSLAYCRCSEHH
ncbi:hypothetical protein F5B22DRAFT_312594 [Xylaria bambusicola]|uniref:uncharacterized protein n=1 Tax=Xylaria bambusicola TaxID=326684 RepID=UPI002008A43C|nr:uncharacterized protein F5B22DRAFT_312594 [Xylaria bambusicola]KAI0509703.1 hypothetical protein F5B22DRAFT_312594 [Xylaria bambusicola]